MDPYIGEIKVVGFNFAPIGYAFCDGQIFPVAQNQTLFAVIGTAYAGAGDGKSTFNLPDFRGRFPMHTQADIAVGTQSGSETMGPGNAYQSGSGLSARQMPPCLALNFIIAIWGAYPSS